MNYTQLINKLIINTLDEHKAEDIVILDVRQMTSFTDHMIICSATSTRHIKALINHLIVELKKHDIRPLGIEGNTNNEEEWALVDLGNIIAHVMLPQAREFYSLEKLWSAPITASTVATKTKKVKKETTSSKSIKSKTTQSKQSKPKITKPKQSKPKTKPSKPKTVQPKAMKLPKKISVKPKIKPPTKKKSQ